MFIKHGIDLSFQISNAPALYNSHFRIELPPERFVNIYQYAKMAPCQLSARCADNFPIWKTLREPDHVKKVSAVKSSPKFPSKLISPQQFPPSLRMAGTVVAKSHTFGGMF